MGLFVISNDNPFYAKRSDENPVVQDVTKLKEIVHKETAAEHNKLSIKRSCRIL